MLVNQRFHRDLGSLIPPPAYDLITITKTKFISQFTGGETKERCFDDDDNRITYIFTHCVY